MSREKLQYHDRYPSHYDPIESCARLQDSFSALSKNSLMLLLTSAIQKCEANTIKQVLEIKKIDIQSLTTLLNNASRTRSHSTIPTLLVHALHFNITMKIQQIFNIDGYSKLEYIYLALNDLQNCVIQLDNKQELYSILSIIFNACTTAGSIEYGHTPLITNTLSQPIAEDIIYFCTKAKKRFILPIISTALDQYPHSKEKPLNIENLKEFCMDKWMSMLESNPNITLLSL